MIIPYTKEYAFSEFKNHGEWQLMEKLTPLFREGAVVFDVGCNIGYWASMVRYHEWEHWKQGTSSTLRNIQWNHVRSTAKKHLHLFEMVPETFDKMLQTHTLDEKTHPNGFGLSNCMMVDSYRYVPGNDRVSTTIMELHHDQAVNRMGLLITGQQYCQIRDIDQIDYLKIDTEGHELNVLLGFGVQLREHRIKMIQFEYGYSAVLTKNLLVDFYRLLQDHFWIGKITPEGIRFKDYHLMDEDFIGPDYLALHRSQGHIRDVIAI